MFQDIPFYFFNEITYNKKRKSFNRRDRMAKVFNTPEDLDVHFKFFGGKFSIKDLMYRMIGLPPAIFFGAVMNVLTGSPVWTSVVSVPWFILGFLIGGSKVFDGSVLLLNAIVWESKLNTKTKPLINKRSSSSAKIEFEESDKDKKKKK